MKKKSKKKLWLYNRKRRWLLNGSISTHRCIECDGPLLYFDKYDALCCPRCNIWNDSKCSDTSCDFCTSRPETPDMGLYEAKYYYFDKKGLFTKKYSHRLKRKDYRELKRELQCNNEERH